MSDLPILLQTAVVYLVAAITPGPNFLMISQLPLAGRRRRGAKLAADFRKQIEIFRCAKSARPRGSSPHLPQAG